MTMFTRLRTMNTRPPIFAHDTVEELWTEPHRAERMLRHHLDGSSDLASRTTAFIERSVRWMSGTFGLGPGKAVADLGCGPGLYTNRLARTGAKVVGVDFSAGSTDHARRVADRAGLAVEYVTANYLTYRTRHRFDVVTLIFCDFCALGPGQRLRLLSTVRTLLKPGGYFLFDVWSLAAFDASRESATYTPMLDDGFWSPHPYFGFRNSFRYEAEKVTLDRYEIVEENRTSVFLNWLQHFDHTTLIAELEAAGLRCNRLFGDVAGAPYDPSAYGFAIVAGPA
jgi:SAM-dependent methyltransferase